MQQNTVPLLEKTAHYARIGTISVCLLHFENQYVLYNLILYMFLRMHARARAHLNKHINSLQGNR